MRCPNSSEPDAEQAWHSPVAARWRYVLPPAPIQPAARSGAYSRRAETGSWSDHAGFACAGIPIANVESTNYKINGEYGYDGYSQSTHPDTWDCFDKETHTACDRDNETKWGKIWHTEFDRLDKLDEMEKEAEG